MRDPAHILVVCTGNICRSPLIEALLRQTLAARGVGPRQVVVASAGVRAMVDDPMTDGAQRELAALGGAAAPHRARQLTEAMVQGADLVLTADRGHRRQVAALDPQAEPDTFTLRELHRLIGEADLWALPPDPAERVRSLAQVAAAQRSLLGAPSTQDDDIEDPYGQSGEVYAHVTRQLEPAATALATAIASGR